MDDVLSKILSRNALKTLAWGQSFERGQAYFRDGSVRALQASGGVISAKVQGTRTYRVRLWSEDGELRHDCSCPLGDDELFCKHCVAIGLAWLDPDSETTPVEEAPDIRAYLGRLDKVALVELVLERAEEDERLHRRLTTQAARAAARENAGGTNLAAYRGAIDDAVGVHGFVDYRDMYDYGSGLDEVAQSIDDLLVDGQAEAAITLAEYGLEAVEGAIEHVDDSDGWMGDMLERLQEIHLEACRQAPPEPVDLAGRLYEIGMESGYGVFWDAVKSYGVILGKEGLSAYRALAEADWAKVPTLGPGDEDPNKYGGRLALTRLMTSFAEASGNLDELIAVKSKDLSSAHDFLQISEACRDAGQPAKALDWAEKGWAAFDDYRRDGRLREFLANCYHEGNRNDEAMGLIWQAFAEMPGLAAYKALEHHATRADAWPAWQAKAMALIHAEIAGAASSTSGRRGRRSASGDGSLLVEVHLYEKNDEAAWSAARAHGCFEALWLDLARRRERNHPNDAIEIYSKKVTSLLRQTGNHIYDEAVGYLERVAGLGEAGQNAPAFKTMIQELRVNQKRKRNLMKLLDRKGW